MGNPLVARMRGFGTTIFAEMSALALSTGAINLGQGFPDTDGPREMLDAAIDAINTGRNQYPPGAGVPELLAAIAEHQRRFYGLSVDPTREVLVTAGATEAIAAVILGLCEPNDEVVTFEPYYDSYAATIALAGAVRRTSVLRFPDFAVDEESLRAAFSSRTRLVLLNTPHNPTGKVFSAAELARVAELCQQWDCLAITDEVYEHLVYAGARHARLAQLPGMATRTLTLSSMSKTFSFTGWRIGWVTGPPDLSRAVRLAHQFVLDCSATPLQAAAAAALALDDSYYSELAASYQLRRDFLAAALQEAGFEAALPAAGFFILAGFGRHDYADDFAACQHLAAEVGVAAIPPSAFFTPEHKHLGQRHVRFAFCKSMALLEQAAERLRRNTRLQGS